MMKILNLALFILISMNNRQFPFYANVDKKNNMTKKQSFVCSMKSKTNMY